MVDPLHGSTITTKRQVSGPYNRAFFLPSDLWILIHTIATTYLDGLTVPSLPST